jgi:hypothetical protein
MLRTSLDSLDDLESHVYKIVWDNGPYTSFRMLDYLIHKSRIAIPESQLQRPATIKDFLSKPEILQGVSVDKMNKDSMNLGGDLYPLFAEETGLCTSFAIKVAHQLKSEAPGAYDFVFHDMGDHRIARCRRTQLVIDSSAGKPLKLQNGQRLKVDGRNLVYEDTRLWSAQVCGMRSSIRSSQFASICCDQVCA